MIQSKIFWIFFAPRVNEERKSKNKREVFEVEKLMKILSSIISFRSSFHDKVQRLSHGRSYIYKEDNPIYIFTSFPLASSQYFK